MKIVDLSFKETFDIYQKTRFELGMNEDDVPEKFVALAARCARNIVDALCKKNGVELVPDLESHDGVSEERH